MGLDVIRVANNDTSPRPSSGIRRRRDGCTECKRKKVRCDLQKPICTRCLRYPRGCTYTLSIVPDKVSDQLASGLASALLTLRQPTLDPSPLLQSDEAKFYMHVFSTETALRLFPAAPPIFLQSLIAASVETPHLFYALLAAACSHHGRLVGDSSPHSRTLCLRYTTLALSSLNSALQASSEDTMTVTTGTVATAMALCTNDVCNGNMHVWRTHLSGAGHLLAALLDNKKSKHNRYTAQAEEDPYIDCLVKWFTTLDVLAGMSGAQADVLYSERVPWYRPVSTTSTKGTVIDNICGYSLDLVPLLVRISHLVHGGGLDLGSGVETLEVSLIESGLYSLLASPTCTAPESSSSPLPSGLSTAELQNTHSAFVHSSLLHLHRRIQKLPQDDPRVRSDIVNILRSLTAISPSSPANILILWPIFSAGCETSCPAEREFIHERMHHMQKLGLGNFTRAAQLLGDYWGSQTALPWDVYFSALGCEMVLF
ncbi:fungal-specific transcription factor domain-containing protein [Aspergillus pseudoustus]|uniref:Fungal-specific transcription factor domain-containing protein n=1 Tax=Aspergillus pseudoustus TaxID=1810923 RepID=A0ABR4IQ27_9EURO